ncbi:MAG TPA: LuxR family transcriptional regulator, partial [Hyphomonadaceae bacterium]|nr:LuxR family transcriptional regulator [Hyphomonadaceae bacterium]
MLVEREEELQTLLKAIEAARAGHGQIALISGEAGIGKSTLLSAFRVSTLSTYPELRWCSGNCEALFTPRTLGPVHDMGEALGENVVKALNSDAGQTGLYAAILHALETHDASVLIFEDLHWADYATLDLLKFLSRRISTLPVMLILTFRDDEVGLEHPLTQLLGDLP